MMDTQLTKRVGTLHDIHKKDISTYKQNCGKMFKPTFFVSYIWLTYLLSKHAFLLVKKCSGQCVKGDLVNLQKHKTCQTGVCVKG